MSLSALARADENSSRFDLKCVMRLLCGKTEIERRVGCRSSGLCEEGGRGRDGGRLHSGEIEWVGVRKVGRLGVVVMGERRRELPSRAVPRRLLSLWRARLALYWGRRI